MIKLTFTTEDIKKLEKERYNHPHPKVQKRIEALYLKSQKLAHNQICYLCKITEKTLTNWLKIYRDNGIEGLKKLAYKGSPSRLNVYSDMLKKYFEKNAPRNSAEAQLVIEKLTGIKLSLTAIRNFLKRIGLKFRKIGHVPGKALQPDKIQEQKWFHDTKLKPLLKEAKEGKRTLFL